MYLFCAHDCHVRWPTTRNAERHLARVLGRKCLEWRATVSVSEIFYLSVKPDAQVLCRLAGGRN